MDCAILRQLHKPQGAVVVPTLLPPQAQLFLWSPGLRPHSGHTGPVGAEEQTRTVGAGGWWGWRLPWGKQRKYYVATGPSWVQHRVPHCAHLIIPQPLVLGGKRMRLGLHHCGAARGFWKTLNGAQSHTKWGFSKPVRTEVGVCQVALTVCPQTAAQPEATVE